MKLSKASSPLKQLHKTAWKFQQTFRTPRRSLSSFVSTILSSGPSLQSACVTIEVAVLEPERLIEVLTRNSLPPQYQKGTAVIADGPQEIEDVLCAVLYDCMDFLFVPTPKPFVIYADHNEYTTFYANTRSNLNRVADALLAKRFEEVPEYQRRGLR